jgi:hypothetical protein
MTRKPFFSNRNIVLIFSCVFLVYVISNGLFIGYRKYEQFQQHRQDAARAEQYNKLSPIEKAIKRGEAYQSQRITATHPFHRLLFDYLQRSFGLDPKLSVAKSPFDIPQKEDSQSVEIRYLARIAFPDEVMKERPKQEPEGISFTNIYAANCDNLGLPNNFWAAMDEQYKSGGYYLTHDSLAFRFLKDNKCAIPDDAKVLESQVNRGMVAIVNDPDTSADLRYEAIAFLLLAGERSEIKQEWVDQIASEQLSSGGWAVKKENKVADDHATLLAMWSLLQYQNPTKSHQPLIRHPAE